MEGIPSETTEVTGNAVQLQLVCAADSRTYRAQVTASNGTLSSMLPHLIDKLLEPSTIHQSCGCCSAHFVELVVLADYGPADVVALDDGPIVGEGRRHLSCQLTCLHDANLSSVSRRHLTHEP